MKELLHTYEKSITRKDEVISNMTHALQKHKEKYDMLKKFSEWKLQHVDVKREVSCKLLSIMILPDFIFNCLCKSAGHHHHANVTHIFRDLPSYIKWSENALLNYLSKHSLPNCLYIYSDVGGVLSSFYTFNDVCGM